MEFTKCYAIIKKKITGLGKEWTKLKSNAEETFAKIHDTDVLLL